MSVNSMEYYEQKKALLNRCLNLSEELIGSIEEWDPVPVIISEREAVIQQLQKLEDATDHNVKSALSHESKQELDQMIKLIQGLDTNAVGKIREEQLKIKGSLVKNTQGQKLMQYASATEPSRGNIMDYKK